MVLQMWCLSLIMGILYLERQSSYWNRSLGPDSIKRCHLTTIGNLIVEIRRSFDRLISTMGFPILVRRHLYIESGPRFSVSQLPLPHKPLVNNSYCQRMWNGASRYLGNHAMTALQVPCRLFPVSLAYLESGCQCIINLYCWNDKSTDDNKTGLMTFRTL